MDFGTTFCFWRVGILGFGVKSNDGNGGGGSGGAGGGGGSGGAGGGTFVFFGDSETSYL